MARFNKFTINSRTSKVRGRSGWISPRKGHTFVTSENQIMLEVFSQRTKDTGDAPVVLDLALDDAVAVQVALSECIEQARAKLLAVEEPETVTTGGQ
jgi:hypothetical protein